MVNKVVLGIALAIVAVAALVLAVLLATGAVRLAGQNVPEIYCTGPDNSIVLCEDLD